MHALKGVHNCEIIHCGKTGDGGIDLKIINSDKPILVQVKRRTESRANFAEPIKDVREFLGAMVGESEKGIYVTTANKFSKQTKNTIEKKINSKIVTQFDLVNFDALISLFNLGNQNKDEVWENLIKTRKETH